LIVCDLQLDPQGLLDLDAETLRQRLYTRREDLAEGELPVPLKLIHINRCPVVAPLSVLRPKISSGWAWIWRFIRQRALRLSDAQKVWQDKVRRYTPAKISPRVRTRNSSYTTVLSVIAIGAYANKCEWPIRRN
jgi:exonuclease I